VLNATFNNISVIIYTIFQGRIQDFKLRGAHLKKLRRAEGGAKNLHIVESGIKHQYIWPPCYTLLKVALSTNKTGIQDFKLRGAHLKKLRRAEGGAKNFGVFRVKNHDFTPKNHIFPILGGAREIFGVFHVKNFRIMI
jgi:hypothetical protein